MQYILFQIIKAANKTIENIFREYVCKYNVRLGTVDWKKDEEGTHVDRSVSAIYRHPDYGRLRLFKTNLSIIDEYRFNLYGACSRTRHLYFILFV